MSKNKNNNLQFVKHVPDFLVKMGLNNTQVKEHQSKNQEAKLEDKFAKKPKSSKDEEFKLEEYDFENA